MNKRWCQLAAAGGVLTLVMGLLAAGLAAAPRHASADTARDVAVLSHIGGRVRGIFPTGSYLLVGRGAELEVLSADGASRLGGVLLPAVIMDIAVSGARAYVSTVRGLSIVDLGSLSSPHLVRSLVAPIDFSEAEVGVGDVETYGGQVYVALWGGGLWRIDASTSISSTFGSWASDLSLIGNRLIDVDAFSTVSDGVEAYDLGNPTTPPEIAHLETTGLPKEAVVVGTRLYVASYYPPGGLEIFSWNSSNPAVSTRIGYLALGNGAWNLAVTSDGKYAFLSSDLGLVQVNVADAAHPALVAKIANVSGEVETSGDKVFVGADSNALQVYRFTSSGLSLVRSRGMRGFSSAGLRQGGNLYLAQYDQGLLKLGLQNPTIPSPTQYLKTSANPLAVDVASAGAYLAVADADQVVVVDPAAMTAVGRQTMPDFNTVRSVVHHHHADSDGTGPDTARDYLLAAAGPGGVCVVEMTDPQHLALGGCVHDGTDETVDLSLSGLQLFVAQHSDGVLVYDLSQLPALRRSGGYAGVVAEEVAANQGYVYVSDLGSYPDYNGQLRILQQTEAGLVLAGSYDTLGTVVDMKFANGLLYLASGQGLQVLYMFSPASFAEWATFASGGSAQEVVVGSGDSVYLMDGANGILVLAATTTGSPPASTPTPSPTPTSIPTAHVPDVPQQLYLPFVVQ